MDLWEIEREHLARGISPICGVDEAGAGPLAGRVYAAAVILPPECLIEGLKDSKKIKSEKKREELFSLICETAVAYAVAWATEQEIDEINILQARMLAMRRAVDSLSLAPALALIDGDKEPQMETPCLTVVKGDDRCASIAAASILAKVSRDRHMLEMARLYPDYAFEQHKGYGTALHFERLRENGPSPIHRRTFLKNL